MIVEKVYDSTPPDIWFLFHNVVSVLLWRSLLLIDVIVEVEDVVEVVVVVLIEPRAVIGRPKICED